MADAKLAPNLPDWMVKHANRYLSSGGTEGHMYKVTVPGRGEITAPALLLTTTGRKSGEKFIFPLFYGTDGGSYFVVASKGGAPEHPGWYRNILANPDVEVQVGTKKMKARARTADGRGTYPALEKGARVLAALRRLSAQDRTRDTGGRAGSGSLGTRRLANSSGVLATGLKPSCASRSLTSAVQTPLAISRASTRTSANEADKPCCERDWEREHRD